MRLDIAHGPHNRQRDNAAETERERNAGEGESGDDGLGRSVCRFALSDAGRLIGLAPLQERVRDLLQPRGERLESRLLHLRGLARITFRSRRRGPADGREQLIIGVLDLADELDITNACAKQLVQFAAEAVQAKQGVGECLLLSDRQRRVDPVELVQLAPNVSLRLSINCNVMLGAEPSLGALVERRQDPQPDSTQPDQQRDDREKRDEQLRLQPYRNPRNQSDERI